MNMDFGANKVHLRELILEIFILVLIINDIKNHGKNMMS